MPNPVEFNLLTNVQFRVDIHSLPNTTYFCQTAVLPSITLDGGMLPSPRRDIPIPGSKLEFEPLMITFLVDQDLSNYEEIYNWMVAIQSETDYGNMLSDISFHFLTGNMNISRTITFVGAFPQTLNELSMNSNDVDTAPTDCSVVFKYQYFKFDKPSDNTDAVIT